MVWQRLLPGLLWALGSDSPTPREASPARPEGRSDTLQEVTPIVCRRMPRARSSRSPAPSPAHLLARLPSSPLPPSSAGVTRYPRIICRRPQLLSCLTHGHGAAPHLQGGGYLDVPACPRCGAPEPLRQHGRQLPGERPGGAPCSGLLAHGRQLPDSWAARWQGEGRAGAALATPPRFPRAPTLSFLPRTCRFSASATTPSGPDWSQA